MQWLLTFIDDNIGGGGGFLHMIQNASPRDYNYEL